MAALISNGGVALSKNEAIDANRIAELEAENKRLKKRLELQSSYCDRKHAFCPDCRDKLPDNFCWRCEAQKLQKVAESLLMKRNEIGREL